MGRERLGSAPVDGNDRTVSVIKINAITVREGAGDELADRFAHRAGAVDEVDGFEGFELLRPDDGRDVWLVMTRWRDDAAFDAWVSSPAFAHGHRGDRRSPSSAHGHRGDRRSPSSADGHDESKSAGVAQPVGRHSELWSYRVVDLPAPS
jgi:heme oxygenase (mycobilin-producing)